MSGSIAGGKRAAITNKQRYGKTFYQAIGAKGGKISRGGGFAYMVANGQRDKVVAAGIKGGATSRKGKWIVTDEAPFDDGFNQPNWWDKLKGRLWDK